MQAAENKYLYLLAGTLNEAKKTINPKNILPFINIATLHEQRLIRFN